MRIALLEDDPTQATVMREWLVQAGHICHVFEAGKRLLAVLAHESFDVLVLDWQLPDLSGIEVLRHMRHQHSVPVLFVTSRDAERDIVEALEAGADDYLVKPPRRMELLARVSALRRRCGGTAAQSQVKVLEHPPYRLDCAERRASVDGREVELTQKEFEVVWFLFQALGRLVSRGHLLEAVWGRGVDVPTRTVDTHVSRIRVKLQIQPEHGLRLASIYGYGYRLEQVNN